MLTCFESTSDDLLNGYSIFLRFDSCKHLRFSHVLSLEGIFPNFDEVIEMHLMKRTSSFKLHGFSSNNNTNRNPVFVKRLLGKPMTASI